MKGGRRLAWATSSLCLIPCCHVFPSFSRVSEPAKTAPTAARPGPGLGVLATHGSRGLGLLLLCQSWWLFALATEWARVTPPVLPPSPVCASHPPPALCSRSPHRLPSGRTRCWPRDSLLRLRSSPWKPLAGPPSPPQPTLPCRSRSTQYFIGHSDVAPSDFRILSLLLLLFSDWATSIYTWRVCAELVSTNLEIKLYLSWRWPVFILKREKCCRTARPPAQYSLWASEGRRLCGFCLDPAHCRAPPYPTLLRQNRLVCLFLATQRHPQAFQFDRWSLEGPLQEKADSKNRHLNLAL